MILPTTGRFLLFALLALVYGQDSPTRQFKSVVVPASSGPDRFAPATERIVYYEDRGFAIAYGDVNVGLEKDLIARDISQRPGQAYHARERRAHNEKRSISIFPTEVERRWPNATVIYKFNDTEAEKLLESTVNGAITRWKEASPFLQFTKSPTSSQVVLGTVTIVVTRNAPACWAPIGYYKDWEMVISLDVACNVASTVHEFGHALGLHHEHQRPDRDNYILFNCSALTDYSTFGGPGTSCPGDPSKCCEDTTCWGWACSFAHLLGYYSNDNYDLRSVMHYREDAFAAPGAKTLTGLNGGTVPVIDSENPTPGDTARICEIYNKECQAGPTGPICGNGVLEQGEECDDGNNTDGDGCSSKCTQEKINPGACETCLPSPIDNRCDITTSCIATGAAVQSRHFCACRAGYKANPGYNETNGDVQWRLPFIGQEYRVFVKPGVICNNLCNNWNAGTDPCIEVPLNSKCMS